MLQVKTYILLTIPTLKTKIKNTAKEWTENTKFRFRNDLIWTELGGNYLLWAKACHGNE